MRSVSLPGSLDITTVTAVRGELLDAVSAGDLVLDATAVTRIDAAGLQLLYAAVTEVRSRGARVSWAGASAAVRAGARILALTGALALPDAADAAVTEVA